jgi:hypothetical protein
MLEGLQEETSSLTIDAFVTFAKEVDTHLLVVGPDEDGSDEQLKNRFASLTVKSGAFSAADGSPAIQAYVDADMLVLLSYENLGWLLQKPWLQGCRCLAGEEAWHGK